MCNFLSAIVMRNGDIICRPEVTDSHADLLRSRGIRDDMIALDRFVRVELVPTRPQNAASLCDPSRWRLVVDEKDSPDWLDREAVAEKLRGRIQRMIVNDEREQLLGGCWILGAEAHVTHAVNARIHLMCGDARIIMLNEASRVDVMQDHSCVELAHDNTMISCMVDYASVVTLRDHACVETMRMRSSINCALGASQVLRMRHYARIDTLQGHARVIWQLDTPETRVAKVCDDARVMCTAPVDHDAA